MQDLTTVPDRRLADWLFYRDAREAERMETDYYGGGEYVTEADEADFAEAQAVRDEIARRERLGIFVEDPAEPTLEERLAPFGPAWQEEQDERRHGGA